jgi:ribosomal protein L7/L12
MKLAGAATLVSRGMKVLQAAPAAYPYRLASGGSDNVATVHLRVEPVFCGPASIGTVELIKLVRERFGLSLAEAKAYVDRCVFDGETIALFAPTSELAAAFAREVGALTSPAKFHVEIEAD